MSNAEPSSSPVDEPSQLAFRELHGRTLHGFSLLLALGDRDLAARLAGDALGAAAPHHDELHHPERAAAWLRRHAVRAFPRRGGRLSQPGRRLALATLGASADAVDGLARLSLHERAALIATDVERMQLRDVEFIVGRTGTALERVLVGARRRYIAIAGAQSAMPRLEGTVEERVHAVARRAIQ
jgi:hypothetical protein